MNGVQVNAEGQTSSDGEEERRDSIEIAVGRSSTSLSPSHAMSADVSLGLLKLCVDMSITTGDGKQSACKIWKLLSVDAVARSWNCRLLGSSAVRLR